MTVAKGKNMVATGDTASQHQNVSTKITPEDVQSNKFTVHRTFDIKTESTPGDIISNHQLIDLRDQDNMRRNNYQKTANDIIVVDDHDNGTRRFVCRICDYVMGNQSNMKRHILLKHQDSSYKCDRCDNKFADRGRLLKHIRVIHEGPGAYVCLACGRRFKSQRGFEFHQMDHTGKYPHFCVSCNKGFRIRKYYLHHLIRHHPTNLSH